MYWVIGLVFGHVIFGFRVCHNQEDYIKIIISLNFIKMSL